VRHARGRQKYQSKVENINSDLVYLLPQWIHIGVRVHNQLEAPGFLSGRLL
jgi:hypothetical protein